MDHLPPQIDAYLKRSIEHSVGLAVPDDALRLKLLASEESSHRLRDRVFLLEDHLQDCERRLDRWKVRRLIHSRVKEEAATKTGFLLSVQAEAAMSARGLRRCVEEKEVAAARCAEMERECALYDRDLERLMESCDELAKENDELKTRLIDASDAMALVGEIESLKEDKEKLRVNLLRAEEEGKLLSEENRQLERENRKLLRRLKKERDPQDFSQRQSTSISSTGKCKSRLKNTNESTISPTMTRDSSREPLSPLQKNSADDFRWRFRNNEEKPLS